MGVLFFVSLLALLGMDCSRGERNGQRVVSIGDLHGDHAAFLQIMNHLGLIDSNGDWAGNDTVLVQLGDVMDRGNGSAGIYQDLFHLQDQAPSQGGRVVLLLGNHELLNLAGKWRHVSESDVASFGGGSSRADALSHSGWLGQGLRRRCQAVALVNGILYVHAGLPSALLGVFSQEGGPEYLLDAVNAAVASELDAPGILSISESAWLGPEGPFWTRQPAQGDDDICEDIYRTLASFDAEHMVIGHTPQPGGKVRGRCNGRLILQDTKISSFMSGDSVPSAVELLSGDGLKAVYPPDARRWPPADALKVIRLGGRIDRTKRLSGNFV